MVNYDRTFNIFLVGGDYTGKSCFLRRLLVDQFDSTIPSTVRIEHKQTTISIDGETILVNIYDVPAQIIECSIIRLIKTIADGVLLFYDITDRTTLTEASQWIKEKNRLIPSYSLIMLVGSKCDMENQRKISQDEIADFTKINNINLLEVCSAVNGTNVNKVLTDIVKCKLKKLKEGESRHREMSFFAKFSLFLKNLFKR